jgi:hypothetical protein
MTSIASTVAADINRHHEGALKSANVAINHALEAGKLLLEVKGSLSRGEWLPWLAANVTVSPRQAQRYIAVAQGKPLPVRATADRYGSNAATVTGALPPAGKNDTVSHLLETPARDWTPRPAFIPLAGHWYWCTGQDGSGEGGMSYVIEPSSAHPGFFFVSHIHEGGDEYDCTRRPVGAVWVETNLQMQGLAKPAAATWHIRPSPGVAIALETLDSQEATPGNAMSRHVTPTRARSIAMGSAA